MSETNQRWTFSLRALLGIVTTGCIVMAAGVAYPPFGVLLTMILVSCLVTPLIILVISWPMLVVFGGVTVLRLLDRWRQRVMLARQVQRP